MPNQTPSTRSDSREKILYGAKAIATRLGVTQRQVYHLAAIADLPTFKLGQIVCVRLETLRAWLAQQETAAVRRI